MRDKSLFNTQHERLVQILKQTANMNTANIDAYIANITDITLCR